MKGQEFRKRMGGKGNIDKADSPHLVISAESLLQMELHGVFFGLHPGQLFLLDCDEVLLGSHSSLENPQLFMMFLQADINVFQFRQQVSFLGEGVVHFLLLELDPLLQAANIDPVLFDTCFQLLFLIIDGCSP